ncbi:MAG: hypoxanthine-guanine phosphoribosyltransferase [Burkholderiaceae bacterium]|nr:hypoxanthine-guanine phosphoribosyltransferase [Burkholderiaceae bacterium]
MFAFQAERAAALLAQSKPVHDAAEVKAAVARLAAQLNQRFGQAGHPSFPLVLGVMGGAVVFTGQLLPQLNFPLEYDYIHVTRYGDDDHGGKVVWKVVPRQNVQGRTVIVLDDILDEGETLAQVRQRLLDMGAAEVVLVVFADKATGRKKAAQAEYVGLSVPDQFVIGFGMDIHGYWRNLPDIRALPTAAIDAN